MVTISSVEDKIRHHYVPKAYLNYFANAQGKVRIYLKDDPDKCIEQAPDRFAYHKYYYSQPLPDGDKDNNRLEDFFGTVEGKWPPIVERLLAREDVNDVLEEIFSFMALQRARVPASRDACEKMLAEKVKATARVMDTAGYFPPKPEGHEDILETAQVSIDPHQSIHAMVHLIRGMEAVYDRIGIGALHNTTNTPFLTSDNPVVWFDPRVPESALCPYVLQRGGPVVFFFPVTPRLIIYGDSSMQAAFAREGFRHGDLPKAVHVRMMNRMICRFAYRAVYAQNAGQEAVIRKYAHLSPVLRTETVPVEGGELLFNGYVFGKRERKPKWEESSEI